MAYTLYSIRPKISLFFTYYTHTLIQNLKNYNTLILSNLNAISPLFIYYQYIYTLL